MPRYVAFLRAINLGPTRKFPMAKVKECLAEAGYTDVETHLATGNVRVTTAKRSVTMVRRDLEKVFADTAGFDIPTAVVTTAELSEVHAEAGDLEVDAKRRYVAFLPDPPSDRTRSELAAWDAPGEGVHLGKRHLHWWTDGSTVDAAIFKPASLKKLSLANATTRDLKVVTNLAQRWGS